MDDKQRIALVETKRDQRATTSRRRRNSIRYQFGNHLGSASLELDEEAQLISYEEYHPYGSTAFQAVRSPPRSASSAIATRARSGMRRRGLAIMGRGTMRRGWDGGRVAIPRRGCTGSNLYIYAYVLLLLSSFDPLGTDVIRSMSSKS